MRVQCPCGCGFRFDIPIRSVLAEAARLAEKRKHHPVVAAMNGNLLSPQELEEKRLRDEARRDKNI